MLKALWGGGIFFSVLTLFGPAAIAEGVVSCFECEHNSRSNRRRRARRKTRNKL